MHAYIRLLSSRVEEGRTADQRTRANTLMTSLTGEVAEPSMMARQYTE